MRVNVSDCLGEVFKVLCQEMIWVGKPCVQVGDLVVCLIVKIHLVGMPCQSRLNGQCQLALQVTNEAVDECCRNGNREKSKHH